MIATPFGISVDYDSLHFYAAGENLLDGKGWVRFDEVAFTGWPPLHPFILACIMLISRIIGAEPLLLMRIFSAVTFGLIIFLSGQLLFFRYLRSKPLALIACTAMLLSPQLFGISIRILSEGVFLVLALLFVYCLEEYIHKPLMRLWLLLCLLAALGCLQRYAGLAFVGTGFLAMLLFAPANLWRRFRSSFGFAAAALIPLAIWFARNYMLIGQFGGFSEPPSSLSDFLENALRFVRATVAAALPPATFSWALSGYIRAAIVLAALLLLWLGVTYWRDRKITLTGLMRQLPLTPVPCIFLLSYVGVVVASYLSISLQSSMSKLVAPVYPFVIAFFMGLLDRLIVVLEQPSKFVWLRGSVTVAAALWLLYPFTLLLPDLQRAVNDGINTDFNTAWRDSSLLAWVQQHELDGVIYSNARAALYLVGDVYAEVMPWQGVWSVTQNTVIDIDWTIMQSQVAKAGSGVYIWFRDVEGDYNCHQNAVNFCFNTGYTMAELEMVFDVQLLIEMEEGSVYRLRPLS